MGTELEIKLHLDDPAQLERVLAWDLLPTLRVGIPYELHMQTTYYDTQKQDFSARHWTVRRRMENGRSIVCVKTKRGLAASPLRGEWETEAPSVAEGLPVLAAMGAPAELPACAENGLVELCGAKFLRRAQLLKLPDGTTCELAADAGVLLKGEKSLPFYELEVELKSGDPEALFRFGRALSARFALHEEPKSKFARARKL